MRCAYCSHDLDDGLRARLISLDALADVPLAGPLVRQALAAGVETQRVIYEINRRIISSLIDDAVRTSRARLIALPSQSVDGVRGAAEAVVDLSVERRAEVEGLKDYLFVNVYRHPRVMAVMVAAERIVRELFERYMAEPGLMPPSWHAAAQGRATPERAAVVADFVAGMTDRYADKEHRHLFDATPDLR